MFFKQLYLGCLAQASYVIGSNGEAVVVDPRRDVDEYIALAAENGFSIKYIIETHLHADFVSGHRELAERTGASVMIAAEAGAEFPHLPVGDGDVFPLGDLRLRVVTTPGHTQDSICIVVEENGRPVKILTGDTLFVGDVGRPDLAAGGELSSEQMAALLYDSLHEKVLTLPDDVEVWPAHGAGSLCGRNMSKETSSTIGIQRRVNYALQPMAKEAFVAMMTDDLMEAPQYFARDVQINRRGAPALRDVPGSPAVAAREAARAIEGGAVVLDVRPASLFGEAHIAGSINISLRGQYASWAGTLISPEVSLLLVLESPDQSEEAVTRLARVGLENVRGFVRGGIEGWRGAGLPLASVPQVTVAHAQQMTVDEPRLQFIDVRRPGEFRDVHAAGAFNVPLHELPQRAAVLDAMRPTALICAGGYRSSIGTSILKRHQVKTVFNVIGGTDAWLAAGLPVERQPA